jgi:hypothetical protein
LSGLWRRSMPKASTNPVRALLRHQWMPTRSTANYARPPRWITGIMEQARPCPPAKITFAEMQEQGVCGVLIYCADYLCVPKTLSELMT